MVYRRLSDMGPGRMILYCSMLLHAFLPSSCGGDRVKHPGCSSTCLHSGGGASRSILTGQSLPGGLSGPNKAWGKMQWGWLFGFQAPVVVNCYRCLG
ncbi:hypothetical protein BDW60DRAFT_134265 [Aspergillus nidulans var. acristatus]